MKEQVSINCTVYYSVDVEYWLECSYLLLSQRIRRSCDD